jgi:hypothetical protein
LGDLLAVTIAYLEPPIIIQYRRNEQTFDTYAYTLTLLHLFLEKHILQDTYPKNKRKYTKIKEKAPKQKAYSRKAHKRNKGEAHLHNYLG